MFWPAPFVSATIQFRMFSIKRLKEHVKWPHLESCMVRSRSSYILRILPLLPAKHEHKNKSWLFGWNSEILPRDYRLFVQGLLNTTRTRICIIFHLKKAGIQPIDVQDKHNDGKGYVHDEKNYPKARRYVLKKIIIGYTQVPYGSN